MDWIDRLDRRFGRHAIPHLMYFITGIMLAIYVADLVLGGHPHVLQPIETRTAAGWDGEARTGFVSYSLGNFISSQVDPLTDTTAVLTVELTRDNVTGEASVTGWDYVPMLMVRRDGTERVFTLTDASSIPTGAGDTLAQRLDQAAPDCLEILGPPPSME